MEYEDILITIRLACLAEGVSEGVTADILATVEDAMVNGHYDNDNTTERSA